MLSVVFLWYGVSSVVFSRFYSGVRFMCLYCM